MLLSWILFAEEEAAKKSEQPGLLVQLMPIFLIVIVFYFLVILPGRKERQQRQLLINALKKNDKVVTNAGIIGVVLAISDTDDEITIKSDETKLRVLKSSIARVLTVSEPARETPKT